MAVYWRFAVQATPLRTPRNALALRVHLVGGPVGVPHQLDLDPLHPVQIGQDLLHIVDHFGPGRTAGTGERHANVHLTRLSHLDIVDQADVHDVEVNSGSFTARSAFRTVSGVGAVAPGMVSVMAQS